MIKYFRRMVYRQDGEYFNVLMHPFLFFSLVFGVAFVFFGWTDTVSQSKLYTITEVNHGGMFVSLWGICCMLAVIFTTLNIWFRIRVFGYTAGWLGFFVWMYAFLAFASTGLYFQALTILPQVYFWIWHQSRIKVYYTQDIIKPL